MRLFDADGLVELRSNNDLTCINMAWTVSYQPYWVSSSNDAAHLTLLWFPTALKVWPLKENTQTGVADVCFSLFFVCLKKKLFGLEIIDKKKKKNSRKKGLYTRREYKMQGKLRPNCLWSSVEVQMQQDGNMLVNCAKNISR